MVDIDQILMRLCSSDYNEQHILLDIKFEAWEVEKLCFNILQLPNYKAINTLILEDIILIVDSLSFNNLGHNGYRLLAIYYILQTTFPMTYVDYLKHSKNKNGKFSQQLRALGYYGRTNQTTN